MDFEDSRPKGDDERVLPLINIVFLLLIFFMLAGRLAATDPFEIVPPRSASDGLVEARDSVVLLDADGRLALDGEVLEETEVGARVAARTAADGTARVWLKADGRVEATRVIAVMEMLRDAGVRRLELLTLSDPS